ncbi:MAG: hypothetical protein HQL67_04420 [Magnetococcales bacterium]|nr:hypothetical protein [Magnetococcales bacterium]
MSENTDLALRIGVSAQYLGCTGPKPLVQALQEYVGTPFTEQKFSKIDAVGLPLHLEKFQISSTQEIIEKVLNTLQQGLPQEEMPADPVINCQSKRKGALRVGLASNTAETLDGHFGSCKQFQIYDVSRSEITHVDTRYTVHLGSGKSLDTEKNQQRVELTRDCDILCVQSIGGPPAARVVNSGIMPLKYPEAQPFTQVLTELQNRLSSPPPWMKKSMGIENRIPTNWQEQPNS